MSTDYVVFNQVFKMVVKWSNGSKTVVYRRYSLFFDFLVSGGNEIQCVRTCNWKQHTLCHLTLPILTAISHISYTFAALLTVLARTDLHFLHCMLLMIHHTALALICTHLHWLPFLISLTSWSRPPVFIILVVMEKVFLFVWRLVTLCKKSGFNQIRSDQISRNFLAALFKWQQFVSPSHRDIWSVLSGQLVISLWHV